MGRELGRGGKGVKMRTSVIVSTIKKIKIKLVFEITSVCETLEKSLNLTLGLVNRTMDLAGI